VHERFGQRVRGNARVVVGVRVERDACRLIVRVVRVEQRDQRRSSPAAARTGGFTDDTGL
jgi:hypothetical protein